MGHLRLGIEPILTVAPGGARVLKDEVGRVRYSELQTQDDERAHFGGRYYTKSGFTEKLEYDLIDVMLETIASATVPWPRISMPPKGGAVERVAPDATAFWHRSALYSVILQTSCDDPAEDAGNVGWAKARWPALESFTKGFYANTNLSEMPADRVNETYGGNFERLVALKTRYDPTNLFRLNANVRPRA